jgi:hypothetical protein
MSIDKTLSTEFLEEETGDGSLSPPHDEPEESRVREEETDDIYAVKGI